MDNNNEFASAPRGDEHTENQQPQPAYTEPTAPQDAQTVSQEPAAPQAYDAAPAQPESPEPAAPYNEAPAAQAEQTPMAAEEPRTPYQTPVQHPMYQTPPQENGQPQQPPYADQTPPPQPPKKKKRANGPVIALCSVAAACLLFAGGAMLGHVVAGGNSPDNTSSATQAGNMPTVQIAQKPDYDPDNYDVVNGLAGEEIYKKVNPSIVSVISTSLDGGGTGSGVIMSADGYIITNNHVVEGAQAVAVQMSDGTKIEATVKGTDAKTDLAVLKIDTNIKLTAAEFGDSDELEPGEYAYAIGSPGGLELANTITGGRISAINRDITIDDRVMTLIQTDASINPGNSGGALINKYGQVVGITSAKLGISYYEGLGFAIPMNTAKEIVDQLIATGYIAGRPSIGITGQNISEQKAQYNNVPQGVYVYSVDERAAAAQQGLMAGDIITEVDGQQITTMDEINTIKEEKQAGDTLKIKVYRMSTGKFLDMSITLTDEHDLSDESAQSQQQEQQQQTPSQGEGGYSQYGDDQNPFSYYFNW